MQMLHLEVKLHTNSTHFILSFLALAQVLEGAGMLCPPILFSGMADTAVFSILIHASLSHIS